MTSSSPGAHAPTTDRKGIWSWMLFDWAAQPFFTVVTTFIFGPYFISRMVLDANGNPDPVAGQAAWGYAIAIGGLVMAVLAPVLGSIADQSGPRKTWIAAFAVLKIAGLVCLWSAAPGSSVFWILLAYTVAAVAAEFSIVFNDSMLPSLVRNEKIGAVSNTAFGLGYLGGMLALGLSLAYVLWAQSQGQQAADFVPVTMGITAMLFAAAALVTFSLLRERAVPNPQALAQGGLRASLARLQATWRVARHYRDFMWLMACAVAYQGGVAVAITLAAIYAEQVVGFESQETMVLIFALNIAAAVGAFAFGYGQDRLGHKRALAITLMGWVVTCVVAALSTTKGMFWYAAVIAGLCMGSSQSAGRAMAGLLAPPAQRAEFYGLWTFATRLASIVGPLTYGAITWATGGNHRLAILSTAALFVVGLLLLWPVNMARGERAAAEAPQP